MKKVFNNTINPPISAIKGFKKEPLNSLGVLIPYLITLINLIVFIIGLIIFFIQGGYSKQFGIIETDGIAGFINSVSKGTSGIFFNNVVLITVSILLLAEMITLLIMFFKSESKFKSIIAFIDLIIICIISVLCFWFDKINTGKIKLSIEQTILFANFIKNQTAMLLSFFIILALISFSIISFVLLMKKSSIKNEFKKFYIMVAISFIGLPLLLWLIENITGICLLLVFTIISLKKGKTRSCPHCKRLFARKFIKRTTIEQKDTLENVSDVRFGYVEHYHGTAVYHTEKYRKHYRCKYCGHKWSVLHQEKTMKNVNM